MGIRARKTFKAGPVRMTVSKSGVSTSVGVKGVRVGKMANGKTRDHGFRSGHRDQLCYGIQKEGTGGAAA